MSSSTSSSDRDWRRFFRLAAGTAVVITGVIYAFVVLVDPWNMLPLSPPLDRAPVTSNQRYAYPSLARSSQFDSAVFGTSTSRLLRPPALNESFHARFANLAMNDATIFEQMSLMTVFLRAHPAPRTIIVGLDIRWCREGEALTELTPRSFPAWMYGKNRWRGYGEMLNMFAIQEAGKEFGVLTRLKKEDMGRDGYTIFVPPDDRYDGERAAAHLREDGVSIPPGEWRGPPSSWRFGALDDFAPALAAMPADTRMILFFVPYNRVRLPNAEHPAADYWSACKAHAAGIARRSGRALVVDFMLPSPITNDDTGYWDSQHYRVGVADRLARDLAAASRGETSADYRILYAPGG